jgi:hypothetical protein
MVTLELSLSFHVFCYYVYFLQGFFFFFLKGVIICEEFSLGEKRGFQHANLFLGFLV